MGEGRSCSWDFSHSVVYICCFHCPHKVILKTDLAHSHICVFSSCTSIWALLFPWSFLSHLAQSGLFSQHVLLDAEFKHRRDIQVVTYKMTKPRHHQPCSIAVSFSSLRTWISCGIALSFGCTFHVGPPHFPVDMCGWFEGVQIFPRCPLGANFTQVLAIWWFVPSTHTLKLMGIPCNLVSLQIFFVVL